MTENEGTVRRTELVWRMGWGWVGRPVEPEVVEDQAVEAETDVETEPAAA